MLLSIQSDQGFDCGVLVNSTPDTWLFSLVRVVKSYHAHCVISSFPYPLRASVKSVDLIVCMSFCTYIYVVQRTRAARRVVASAEWEWVPAIHARAQWSVYGECIYGEEGREIVVSATYLLYPNSLRGRFPDQISLYRCRPEHMCLFIGRLCFFFHLPLWITHLFCTMCASTNRARYAELVHMLAWALVIRACLTVDQRSETILLNWPLTR